MRNAIICGLAILLARSAAPQQARQGAAPRDALQARMLEQYARLPLYFEPNLGQTGSQTQFLARTGGYTMYLDPTGAVMVLGRRTGQAVVRLKLEGAERSAAPAGLDKQPGVSAYFIGNDPKKWHPEVPHYARLEYKGIYPGVDLVYYGDPRRVEYDFTVAPGADPDRIRLEYECAEGVRVDDAGDLVVATRLGDLKQLKPRAYQEVGGRRLEVAASYQLASGTVGFQLAAYDRTRPLVIDPVLTLAYSTYLGGNNDDAGTAIAVDSTGAAYVAGTTWSSNFPVLNAYQTTDRAIGASGGGGNVFVTKLNPDSGTGNVTLAYSTMIGGTTDDYAAGIAVDSYGAAYVTGWSRSSDYPLLYAYQGHSGLPDVIVTKLNAYSGTGPVTLAYSTYLGGSAPDTAAGIAVDSVGAAYVTGTTWSGNFPFTVNAYQKFNNGGQTDAFVTKLNPNNGTSGITLAYSTCLGGTGPDAAYAIAVDGNGAAYVAGSTQSTDFPVSNAYQAAAGGGGDAFVAKLNPAGSSLTYSTYLGGSGNDQAKAIAVDSTGAAYVAGRTNSPYFPTSNAWQGSFAGGTYDAFVSKLNPNTGTGNVTLAWSTYLGGSAQDEANAIALDSSGAVYVAGATWSTDFPLSSAYPASVSLGPCHAFVTSFNPYSGSGSLGVAYSTYFGGTSDDRAYGIAVDTTNAVYVAGQTGSYDIPILNAYQSGRSGTRQAFVSKFLPYTLPATPTTTTASAPASLTYSPGAQNITLSATVTSTSTVNSGTVSFTLLSTTASADVASGSASTGFTVPGGTPAGSYTIQATYNPGSGLAASSDGSKQLVIGKATPVISWSNPADIVVGTALGSTQLNATASVAGAFVYAPPAGTVLQAGLHQTLSTTFTPTDTTDYTTATASVLINVSKTTPVITWSNPADINVGTALSSTQLNATANVAGAFVYAPPAGTVLSLGNAQTLSTTFTPTDTTDYTTAPKSVLINVVEKATPVITWSNPAGIVYGAVLGSTQLNATANVPGTFVYTPPAGTVLQAGTGQTLSTTFTPTDTADYTTATKNVLIDVSKATPVITWAAPAPITYGGALGNGQLNASSVGVAGTFVYTPPAGTVLPVGNGQTLSATFTPTDATDYATAAASTTINVNAAPSPPSGINLVVTKVLTRTGGNVVVQLTVSNTGGTPANNVTLTSVKVGSLAATPLPQNLGTIGASASAQATVSVPGSVGVSGAASSLTAAGTYSGGIFSLSARIALP